jgi:hypothetical protein
MATNSNKQIYSLTTNGETGYFYLDGKAYKKIDTLTSDQKNVATPLSSVIDIPPDYLKNTNNTYTEIKNPSTAQKSQAFPVSDLSTFTAVSSINYIVNNGIYYKLTPNNDFYERIPNPTTAQKSQAIGIVSLPNSPGATYLLSNGEYYQKITKISASRQAVAVDINNIVEKLSLDPSSSNILLKGSLDTDAVKQFYEQFNDKQKLEYNDYIRYVDITGNTTSSAFAERTTIEQFYPTWASITGIMATQSLSGIHLTNVSNFYELFPWLKYNPDDGEHVALYPATTARNIIIPTNDIVPLTIKGINGQTDNLTEWKDSAGNLLDKFHSDGNLSILPLTGDNDPSLVAHDDGGTLVSFEPIEQWVTVIGDSLPLDHPGYKGQLAYDDVYFYVCVYTDKWIKIPAISGNVNIGGDFFENHVALNPSTTARNILQPTANVVPLTIKGHSNQSDNLTEWKDSAGTVLDKFDSSGNLTIKALAGDANPSLVAHDINGKLINLDPVEQWVDTASPLSLTATGLKGQLAYYGNYLYICIDTNLWFRLAADSSTTNTIVTSNTINSITGSLQTEINTNINHLTYLSTVTGGFALTTTVASLTGTLQNQISNLNISSQLAPISAYLQSEINNNTNHLIYLSSVTGGFALTTTVASLTGSLQNQISNLNISSQLAPISAYLQSEIDTNTNHLTYLSSVTGSFALTTDVASLTGSLQNQISNLNISSQLAPISAYLQQEINNNTNHLTYLSSVTGGFALTTDVASLTGSLQSEIINTASTIHYELVSVSGNLYSLIINTSGGSSGSYSGTAERTVGGFTDGVTYSNLSLQQFGDALLKQEKFPTLTNPSSTFASDQTGYKEVGEIINITFTSAFDRGSISPQYTSSSPYRSGLPNTYQYTGSSLVNQSITGLSDIQSIIGYTVSNGVQSWQGRVAYDGGVQPKSSYDNDYSSPLSAGNSAYITRTITGVYPYFGTTVDIVTRTQQTLAAHNATYYQFNMVIESGSDKQTAWFSGSHSAITGIQFYNTISSAWEWLTGTKIGSLTLWTVTSTTIIIQGNNVNYDKYIHNGSLIGARQLRFYTT